MSSLLIVVLLTKFQGDKWGKTGLWKDILDTIQASTALGVPYEEISTSTGSRPVIQVFRSATSASQPVPSSLEAVVSGNSNKNGEELIGLFFGIPSSIQPEVVISKLFDGLSQLTTNASGGSILISIDCRAYQPYSQLKPEQYAPTGEGTLVINCMTPSAETEAAFNKWYAEEHIPLLRLVPGWRSSRRFTLIESKFKPSNSMPAGVPKYLALHEWLDDESFQTKEYEAAVNTPWRTEVMEGVQEKQRFALQHVGKLGEEMRRL